MNSSIDFGNLLGDHWELIARYPMLFLVYGVLIIVLTLSGQRFFARTRDKLDLELLREKNTWKEECYRERKRSSELEHKNRELIEKNQTLQSKNKEQGNRIRELNKERIDLLRGMELLESIIRNMEKTRSTEAKKLFTKETIAKLTEQRERQEVQTIDFDKLLEEIGRQIKTT